MYIYLVTLFQDFPHLFLYVLVTAGRVEKYFKQKKVSSAVYTRWAIPEKKGLFVFRLK